MNMRLSALEVTFSSGILDIRLERVCSAHDASVVTAQIDRYREFYLLIEYVSIVRLVELVFGNGAIGLKSVGDCCRGSVLRVVNTNKVPLFHRNGCSGYYSMNAHPSWGENRPAQKNKCPITRLSPNADICRPCGRSAVVLKLGYVTVTGECIVYHKVSPIVAESR